MGKHLVFVYGTLKLGHVRQNALRGQRYVGIARTMPQYCMYQFKSFPALVEAGEDLPAANRVYGELYEVDDAAMMELDKVEGVEQKLFVRKKVQLEDVTLTQLPVDEVVWNSLASKTAVCYLFQDRGKLVGARDCGQIWLLR